MAEYTPDSGVDPKQLANVSAKQLTLTHPVYSAMIDTWIRNLDLYEGINLGRYVHHHARESGDSHAQRVARIEYRNFCGPVVDLYLHYIFSKPTIRRPTGEIVSSNSQQGDIPEKGIDGEWQQWLKDVNRQRSAIGRFMVEAGRYACIFGHEFVLVDLPQLSEEKKKGLKNEAVRKEMNHRPYLTYYHPTEVTNWALDEDGRLLWVRFREVPPESEDPFDPSVGRRTIELVADPTLVSTSRNPARRQQPSSKIHYRTWTRDYWVLHEVKGNTVKEIGQGKNPLGEVPVAMVYNRRSSRYPFIGQSLLQDIAPLNQAILNLDSLIDESIYQQVLNILVLNQQPVEGEEIVLGVNNVLTYRGDRPPFFLAPSTAPLQLMEERIGRLREEIYRLAKLGGGLGLEPKSTSSGVALAFEFNETNAVLSEHADELEQAEQQIHQLWYKWMNKEWHGVIDYPSDFSVQSFQEELGMIEAAKKAIRSPSAVRELEKRAIKKILQNHQKDVELQIEEEINVIPDIIESFSGPIFVDRVAQAMYQPASAGRPIGPLGEALAEQERQAGELATPGAGAQGDASQSGAQSLGNGQGQQLPPEGPQAQGP